MRALGLFLGRQLPVSTALLAVLVDLMPLPDAAPGSPAPNATLCVVAFWTLVRPELLTPLATFAVGLVLDAAGGLPLGLTPLALLLARAGLLAGRRFLAAQPFAVLWGCFALAALAVELARWLVASLWWRHLFALEPLLFQIGLTVATYPLVSALLTRLHQHVVQKAHAAARG